MTTTTLFGIIMDGAAVLAVFIYMPIANYFIRKHEQEMAPDAFDADWYECDM